MQAASTVAAVILAVVVSLSPLINVAAANDDSKFFTLYKPAGLQSGPDAIGGSTFASAAVYNVNDNSVLVTGSTWGRFFESPAQILDEDYDVYGAKIEHPDIVEGCFLATANLPGTTLNQQEEDAIEAPKSLFWSQRQRLRAPTANEACNAIHFFDESETILVAGHTEERLNQTVPGKKGLLQETTVQSGMLMAQEWNDDGDNMYSTVGGQLFANASLNYPTAMTSRSYRPDDGLFVVFMDTASDTKKEATHINIAQGQQPRDPADFFDYGAGNGFSVARFDFATRPVTADTTQTTIAETWMETYDTVDATSLVFVNDIVKVAEGLLVVVGTTNGYGKGFGADTNQGSDMDGFLVKVSPNNGQLIIEPGMSPSFRIQSNNKKHAHDYATAICTSSPNDAKHHVYIAGTSQGVLPGSSETSVSGTTAYLMKFDVRHMTVIWTRQLGAATTTRRHETMVRGMACAVTPDGASVWLGGLVGADAVLPQSGLTQGHGGKDVFVAALDAETGQVQFVRQYGTSQDDELALRGGLVVDAAGNAIVVGNTYGSFFRTRTADEKASDVFVLTVSLFDGSSAAGIDGGSTPPAPIQTKEAPPLKARSSSMGAGFIILSLTLVSLVVVAALYASHRKHGCHGAKSSSVTDRSHVTTYLGQFEVEDVELKHSATGGWHCNFVNRLADGDLSQVQRNRADESRRPPRRSTSRRNTEEQADTLSDGLIRRESKSSHDFLFCDDTIDFDNDMEESGGSSSSTGRLLGRNGNTSESSAYGDLIDAYNSTWSSSGNSQRPYSDEVEAKTSGSVWGKDII